MRAHVVVVGGGVMGTSIALQLARRRAGRVVLCEKRHVASGPTGRSSALLRRHYSVELYCKMAARSFELYNSFEELTGRPAEITRCGLVMAVGPRDVAAMNVLGDGTMGPLTAKVRDAYFRSVRDGSAPHPEWRLPVWV